MSVMYKCHKRALPVVVREPSKTKSCEVGEPEINVNLRYSLNRELVLLQKENDFLQKERTLQRDVSEFNARKGERARSKLEAAEKLRCARKEQLSGRGTVGKRKEFDTKTREMIKVRSMLKNRADFSASLKKPDLKRKIDNNHNTVDVEKLNLNFSTSMHDTKVSYHEINTNEKVKDDQFIQAECAGDVVNRGRGFIVEKKSYMIQLFKRPPDLTKGGAFADTDSRRY